MATRTTHLVGKSAFTADDLSAGTIVKATTTLVYTTSGQRLRLDALGETWSAL